MLGSAQALHLRSLGEELRAGSIRAGNEASQNGGKSESQEELASEIDSQSPVLNNAGVSRALTQANQLAATLVEQDDLCEREWSAPCPDGWTLTGSFCSAPASYSGACAVNMELSSKSIREKAALSSECHFSWPCTGCPQGREYSGCPEGWQEAGTGWCKAPHETACAEQYNFAEMDTGEKQELGQTCGFQWKCKETCQQDFSKACPKDWNELAAGLCAAPASSSAGICAHGINTTSMTNLQKEAYSKKCAVSWPCFSSAAAAAAAMQAKKQAGFMPDGPISSQTGRIQAAFVASPAAQQPSIPAAVARFFVQADGPA